MLPPSSPSSAFCTTPSHRSCVFLALHFPSNVQGFLLLVPMYFCLLILYILDFIISSTKVIFLILSGCSLRNLFFRVGSFCPFMCSN